MGKALRRTQNPEARKQFVCAMQRYAAEQQHWVYLYSQMFTGSWQPYVKNYAHNLTFDFGSRVAALWLDRQMSVAYIHYQFPGSAGVSPAAGAGWKPALPGSLHWRRTCEMDI